MPKLCQITALLTGKKTAVQKAITEISKKLQKPALFQGLSRRYTPRDADDRETYPDETQRVQFRVLDCLEEVREAMTNMMDLTATQDVTNCLAKANVVVDGVTILENVPVTHLLWLEKTLTDLHTIVESSPTLDPAETWTYDGNVGYYVSEPASSTKTKKTAKVIVKYPATPEHPAQTELINDDVIVGSVKTLKFSAAIAADKKKELLARVVKLQEAVKLAREEANSGEAVSTEYGSKVFDFVLGTK